MRKFIFVAFFLFFPLSCFCQGLTLTAASTHYYSKGPKTEINPGFIRTLPISKKQFGVAFRPSYGLLLNSVNSVSILLGTETSYAFLDGYAEVSVRVGFATGYQDLNGIDSPLGIVPMTSQSLRIGTKRLKIEIIHIVPSAFGFGIHLSM